MKKSIIITTLLIVGAGGIWLMSRPPKVKIISLDKANNKAKIKIGSKEVNYVYNKTQGMVIPKVSMFYEAHITPNKGTMNMATVELKRNGKLVSTDNLYFD